MHCRGGGRRPEIELCWHESRENHGEARGPWVDATCGLGGEEVIKLGDDYLSH